MNEAEDCNHQLLPCLRWDLERQQLLTNVGERILNFASAIYNIQSAAITDLACVDRGIA